MWCRVQYDSLGGPARPDSLRAKYSVLVAASMLVLYPQEVSAARPISNPPSSLTVRAILRKRSTPGTGVGIVVGIVDKSGPRFVSVGVSRKVGGRTAGPDTIFEIGSVTKVFTGLLLSEMTLDGEVRPTDAVIQYLPREVGLAEGGIQTISLLDLATHTSGLPDVPDNLNQANTSDPYATYTTTQLFAFLERYRPPQEAQRGYAYSNLGMGLLGEALARRAGVGYPTLVQSRITGPLGMTSTGVDVPATLKGRLAVGHDASLDPTSYWHLPALAGAGALHSTARDLIVLLTAELGLQNLPLRAAMQEQLVPRRPAGRSNRTVALGWHIDATSAGPVVWHNGGTGGFRAFLGFNQQTRVGVVVLTNSNAPPGVDDIGWHILTGSPVLPPRPVPKRVVLSTRTLKAYVGDYLLSKAVTIHVTLVDGHMFAQITGQPKLEILPENRADFFWKALDARATFEFDPDGQVKGMVLSQAGRTTEARRLSMTSKVSDGSVR